MQRYYTLHHGVSGFGGLPKPLCLYVITAQTRRAVLLNYPSTMAEPMTNAEQNGKQKLKPRVNP